MYPILKKYYKIPLKLQEGLNIIKSNKFEKLYRIKEKQVLWITAYVHWFPNSKKDTKINKKSVTEKEFNDGKVMGNNIFPVGKVVIFNESGGSYFTRVLEY